MIVSSLAQYAAQFSPDGNQIAFESNRSGGAEEIWVAQADGSKPIQMTHNLGRHQGSPQWSPDGRWIAFDSEGEDGHWDIYVMESDGSRPRRLTTEPSDETIPSWSRDGRWIYFASDRTGRFEIFRMSPGGGAVEQVTKEGGYVVYESADATTLFYTKTDSSPLFARSLSGGPERKVLGGVTARAFFPVADGIYYIGGRDDKGQFPLEFYRFSSQKSAILTDIDNAGQGLSVSPDRTAVLFTKATALGNHLMMIENFH